MGDEKDVGLMLRLPFDLREELKKYAAGNGKRPRASLNATILFLLRSGLNAERQKEQGETQPGPMFPALLHAA